MSRGDVEQIRVCCSQPGTRVILIGDGVDAESRAEGLRFGRGVGLGDVLEGLGESVCAAPGGEVEGFV